MRIGLSSSYMSLEAVMAIGCDFEAHEIVIDWPLFPVDKCKEFLRGFLHSEWISNDFDILLHAPMRDLNIFSFVPEIRRVSLEILKNVLNIASSFGIGIVTVHSGYIPDYDFDIYKPVIQNTFARCKEYLKNNNVVLAIENIYEFSGEILNNILRLASSDGVFERIKLTYDAGHVNVVGHESQSEFIQKVQKNMVNVHLHDNDGSDDQHLVLGKGTLPLKEVVSSLLQFGYDGPLIIENKSLDEAVESRENLSLLLRESEQKALE